MGCAQRHEQGEVDLELAVMTALEGFRKIPKGVMHVSLLPRLVQEEGMLPCMKRGRRPDCEGRAWERRSLRVPCGSTRL